MTEHCLMELDKRNAEWVVTAYLCGDVNMIKVHEDGRDAHSITGSLMSGLTPVQAGYEDRILGHINDPDKIKALREKHFPDWLKRDDLFLPRTMSVRQAGKKSNHGFNYRLGHVRFALNNEMKEIEGKRMRRAYLDAYPNIENWWKAIETELRVEDRVLWNCFGRKRRFMDQWGVDLFEKATAFKPQSTVADVVNQGMARVFGGDGGITDGADLLANTHDSLTFQHPVDDWWRMAKAAIQIGLVYMNPEMEYGGRSFKIGTDLKIGPAWGDSMKSVPLVVDPYKMEEALKETWESFSSEQEAA